jgi:5'-phosphate synthase pdxT subunit
MNEYSHLRVGVLALQGDFQRHCHQLSLVGAKAVEVRLPRDLDNTDALILPGGESTTVSTLIDRFELRRPLGEFGRTKPVWGTCAGMVLMAGTIENNQAGIRTLGLIDIDVMRNGYGRQVFSFEESITANFEEGPVTFEATFIRAPKITRVGAGVKSLAEYAAVPVLVAQNHLLASSFHTELTDDTTLLEYFLKKFVGVHRQPTYI